MKCVPCRGLKVLAALAIQRITSDTSCVRLQQLDPARSQLSCATHARGAAEAVQDWNESGALTKRGNQHFQGRAHRRRMTRQPAQRFSTPLLRRGVAEAFAAVRLARCQHCSYTPRAARERPGRRAAAATRYKEMMRGPSSRSLAQIADSYAVESSSACSLPSLSSTCWRRRALSACEPSS